MLPERQVLLAPDVVARAAAGVAPEREQRWMLRQPRGVRRSFAEEVLGRPDEEHAQQVWMLHQPRAVRESFVREVLLAGDDHEAVREEVWMLRQDDDVCRSYARFVLCGEGSPATI